MIADPPAEAEERYYELLDDVPMAAQLKPNSPIRGQFNMRPGFKLKVAMLGISAEVIIGSALDVDRVRVVPFDRVAAVAVHCRHELREEGLNASWRTASEGSGPCG
jgi:hypothetical protein